MTCVDQTVCLAPGSTAPFCLGGRCNVDECESDADCPSGGVCSCQDRERNATVASNRCVAASCRVDADCGSGGYCSPTVSATCGPVYGVQGYYCHTGADSCSNDSDCAGNSVGAYCVFDTAIARWACGGQHCTG